MSTWDSHMTCQECGGGVEYAEHARRWFRWRWRNHPCGHSAAITVTTVLSSAASASPGLRRDGNAGGESPSLPASSESAEK